MDAAQKRLDTCVEQDKKLEANFIRALGDIDEDVIKKLLNLYKRRKNPSRKDKTTSRASQSLRAAGRRVSRAGAALRAADKLKSSKGSESLAAAAAAMMRAKPTRTPRPTPAPPTTSFSPRGWTRSTARWAGRAAELSKPRPPPVEPLDPRL